MPVKKKLPGILNNPIEEAVEVLATPVEVSPPKPKPSDNKCPYCGYCSNYWLQDSWLMEYGSHGVNCYSCGRNIKFPYLPVDVGIKNPTTQKAKGVKALSQITIGDGVQALKYNLLLNVKQDPQDEAIRGRVKQILPQFVRPCPPSPEHGFVESRVVETLEEFDTIFAETKAANEDSELMFMNPIEADLNCVWVPTMLAIGPGHDGATSGKGAISVPLAGQNPLNMDQVHSLAGVKEGAWPYIEAVIEGASAYITQLRGGPPLDKPNPDFVPNDMTVVEVLKTNGEDLLEWAKMVRGLKGKHGIVVWHPGGAITDHYSVHCRENGVPIVITFEPSVGQELCSNTGDLLPIDPQAVLRGLAAGDKVSYQGDNYGIKQKFVHLLLIALHNSSVMKGPASFWIGVGVSAILKLGVAALEAEARHAHQCYGGMKNKPDIYNYYTARKLSFLRARLSRVTQILHYGFGDPDGNKSYGGRKWALCGAALVPLFNGIRKLAEDPTEENASELALALNVAVNQAHNNGWWLNKYDTGSSYDTIPKGWPGQAIGAAPAFWAAHKASDGISEGDLKKWVRQVKSWPLTEIKPLKWRKASLDVMPNAFVLNLKASTIPTPKTLTIPVTSEMIKKMLSIAGEVKIDRGLISFIDAEGNAHKLWEEVPLIAESRDVHRR